MINEANNLDQTAIIDCRGPDPGAFHDAYRAFAMRARLDRANGNHANQLIWEGPALIIGDARCEANSFDAMDKWLTAVEKDKAKGSVAQKVARDKPTDLTDRCYDGSATRSPTTSAATRSSRSTARRGPWPATRSRPTRTSASSSR